MTAMRSGEGLFIASCVVDGRGPTRTGDPLGVSEVLWPTELHAPSPGLKASDPQRAAGVAHGLPCKALRNAGANRQPPPPAHDRACGGDRRGAPGRPRAAAAAVDRLET